MSYLSFFCPVKVFGYIVRGEKRNAAVSKLGSLVAMGGFSGSGILLHFGFKEWVKPAYILGSAGGLIAILALENEIICAEKRIKSEIENSPPTADIVKAVKYLATYYWMFWEEKTHNESEILTERLVRPNIPSEFAYAFGNAILKVLEMKINARFEKVCEREGDEHPEKWEFRTELRELDMIERDLWVRAKGIMERFRTGPKAFNLQREDQSLARPLLYCTFVDLLRGFHPEYKRILLESRAKKRELISRQMAEPTINLPIIPRTFQEPTSSGTARGRNYSESSRNIAEAAEVPSASGERVERSAVEGFMGPNDDPVVFSRHEHLCLADEPSAALGSQCRDQTSADSQPESHSGVGASDKSDSADAN